MMKATYKMSALLSALLLCGSPGASAQIVDVSPCRAIEDRLQRFDCYEKLEADDAGVAPPQPAARTAPPVQPAIAERAAPPAQAEKPAVVEAAPSAPESVDRFGTRAEKAPARVLEGADGKTELLDTIASLEQRLPNLWLVTLQSGQTWAQMLSRKYPMKVGDEVRIYPSRWGSAYRLTATRLSGFIQVERID